MIPDVSAAEYTAECERLAKGERGWSQIPLVTKPWWLLALREAQGK
tara:strand:+ start:35 stop:172 length:138 start_codon:yes stop_codon:yes gene_type:complete